MHGWMQAVWQVYRLFMVKRPALTGQGKLRFDSEKAGYILTVQVSIVMVMQENSFLTCCFWTEMRLVDNHLVHELLC
jgi:hypothetical protein